MCVLPPYPMDGQYEVAGDPSAVPGDELEYVFLNVSCTAGKGVVGNNVAICIKGEWSTQMPQCVSFCRLPVQVGTEYSCRSNGEKDFRSCSEYEPVGSRVKTKCLDDFFNPEPLQLMQCVDGIWDSTATCVSECGIIPKKATSLPWHAIIYRKEAKIFKPLCGGTIISSTLLISAAHCFWNSFDQKPVNNLDHAVALGKSTQGWDVNEQKYDITDIKISTIYSGDNTNFQGDISVLKVDRPIQFSPYIRPVCIDFDHTFESSQLRATNPGKISFWSDIQDINSKLAIMDIPYIPIMDCIRQAPSTFKEYITADKMCAGYKNGTSLCKGNSGAGLVFPDEFRGTIRYYLRGVLSTAPNNDQTDNCVNALIAFTLVSAHEHFIKPLLK